MTILSHAKKHDLNSSSDHGTCTFGELETMANEDAAVAPAGVLKADVTLPVSVGMTAAQINAAIATAVNKLGNGKVIRVQLADGTHNLAGPIVIPSFIGGIVQILGNAANNTRNGTKAVIVSSATDTTIEASDCTTVHIFYLDLRTSSAKGAGDEGPVYLNRCDKACVDYCNLINTHADLGTGCGVYANQISQLRVRGCLAQNTYMGLNAIECASILAMDNGYQVTSPTYGMMIEASTCYTNDANQFPGSTAAQSGSGAYQFVDVVA